jgi:hypothetical protein
VSERFDAAAVAGQIRDRLWRYLSETAVPVEIAAVAESLFDLPPHEVTRLAAAHLVGSPGTAAMLDGVEGVLRDLPSSVTRSEVELRAGVRQPVLWPRTYQRRLATGDPQRFVCRPPERGYDTALGRLCVFALDRCAELPQRAQIGHRAVKGRAEAIGPTAARRGVRASRLRRHAKLREVATVRRLPERTLTSLRRHRGAEPVIDWVRRAAALEDRSPRAVREVIEEQLLGPSQTSTLFELFVGFGIVDALVEAGFEEAPGRLFPNRLVPFARLTRGSQAIEAYWQRSLWSVSGLAPEGRYAEVLDAARMDRSALRPDFVIRSRNPDRLATVEVKLTEAEDGSTPERRGIQDALVYAHDAESLLEGLPQPHGLVIAWNATGRPAPGRIVVAGQAGIADAIGVLLDAWTA